MVTTGIAILLVVAAELHLVSCGGGSSSMSRTPTRPAPGTTPNNSVTTYHNDNARTGLNPSETTLTPANVNPSSFGKLFVIPVDGKVDAQPLYLPNLSIPNQGVHNVLYVATEHGTVYGLDADTGAQLWKVSSLASGETTGDDGGCGQVSPEIGVSATPVIDPKAGSHGTIYVVGMSKDGSGAYHHRLHALDVTTGFEQFGGPKEVQATYPGTGDNSSNGRVVFDPRQYKERPGLLLINGIVYTTWSSHCDRRPYTGWIMGYDGSTLAQTGVLNVTPNGNEGAFWMSGTAPAADADGNIFALDANGLFDATLDGRGFPSNGDFGNAFLKISTANKQLAIADYFEMFNQAQENGSDTDLGSGGALLLPDMTDSTGNTRHLSVGGGKDRHIYVIDRDSMGKFDPQKNNIYQDISGVLGDQVFSMPAYFNNTIYIAAVGDEMKAFPISQARVANSPSSHTATDFPYPGATPSISSNGATNGIVWAVENNEPAVLHAYDATNLSTALYSSDDPPNGRDNFGNGNKFITPTVINGKVYVGTTNSVGVFGLFK
jgi:outer membrane protein assembly factor BamB